MTVLKDGDRYRLYYRTYPGGEKADGSENEMTCCASRTTAFTGSNQNWVSLSLGERREQHRTGQDTPIRTTSRR